MSCKMTYCESEADKDCPSGFCELHCHHNDGPTDTSNDWRKGSYWP